MKNIIICGDHSDRILTKTIVSACANYGGALVLDGTKIFQTSASPDFVIISVNSLSGINCGGIFVTGEALCQLPPEISLGDVIPVVDTDNTDALSFLRGCRNPVVGCSMSGRDTVDLTCVSGSKKLVGIQRSITTLGGNVIEPCEICLYTDTELPVFPMLAAFCVLLLSDVPFENGYRV